MTKPVKPRPYNSSVRREQADRTRARIVAAAGELFMDRGYPRTTVKQIAQRAGVAPDTVYAAFGSKIRVLTALIDARLAPRGDANVTDRPEAQAVRDAPTQRDQLHRFARDIASISAGVRPVYEMLRTAASVEPDVAPVFAEMDGHRFDNMHRVATWLAGKGPLRVDVDRAAETIFVLASPDVARMLCDGRGWSEEQYADWLEDALARALLPDGSDGSDGSETEPS
jgi:AcrR family transcriptional regulator